MRTWLRSDTFPVRARSFCELTGTRRGAEIRRRAADIVDDSLEVRKFRQQNRFPENRFIASHLDDPSLMRKEGTERAPAETPPVRHEAELDFTNRRNASGVFILRVIRPNIRQLINRVEFRFRQERRRRVLDHMTESVFLTQRSAADRILFPGKQLERSRKGRRIRDGFLKRRKFNAIEGKLFIAGAVARPAHIAYIPHVFSGA